jgi:hypothetical protein
MPSSAKHSAIPAASRNAHKDRKCRNSASFELLMSPLPFCPQHAILPGKYNREKVDGWF